MAIEQISGNSANNSVHAVTPELVNICNERGELTDKVASRVEAFEQGMWYRVAHVWLYTSQDVLLQFRSSQKKLFPAVWDVLAEGVKLQEYPRAAACRGIQEELGLKIELAEMEFLWKRRFDIAVPECGWRTREFSYAYAVPLPKNYSLSLQKEEVERVQLFPLATLGQNILAGTLPYVPHQEEDVRILAEIQRRINR
jgi:isopentenyldiphosphate isomerase